MRAGSLLIVLLLPACSFLPGGEPPAATLADLQPIKLTSVDVPLPAVSLAELEDIYSQVLLVSADPAVRLQVLHRLADLEMLQAEEKASDAQPDSELFIEAIAAYQQLLQRDPGAPGSDRLLYQLSKAHDFNGETAQSVAVLQQLSNAWPQSPYYLEAQFRIAENQFSSGHYQAAERAYAAVIAFGEASPHYRNALYMHGWAQFKQGNYRPAIKSFSGTLDMLVPSDNQLEQLAASEQALAQDCLKVLAILFSYLEGADSIAAAYDQLGHRHYEPLLYEQLAQLYFKQERYLDSAATYQLFASIYPLSPYAHSFQISVIDIYELAGFAQLILDGKRSYVEAYSVMGDYWAVSSEPVQADISVNLQLFIEQLATHYHALAQATVHETAETDAAAAQVRDYYAQAGYYYQLFIDSFPEHPEVPNLGFLLAESQFEAGELDAALASYQWVAYQYPQSLHAADAGYTAITIFQQLQTEADQPRREKIELAKIDSQLRYASEFSSDSRAPLVLSDAAASLLALADYQLAIIAAATLTHWQPALSADLLIPSWLVIAHSHFELQQYSDAEQGYARAVSSMPGGDTRLASTSERLAASVYRQGEQAAAVGDYQMAATEFVRVLALAPTSAVRLQAQYDAAQNYMQAGNYLEASSLLSDFRQRFPTHELSATVALKLVHNYEQLQRWEDAARELDALQVAATEPERQRELLYLAAEYYDKAQHSELAIERYRSYAHEWLQPVDVRFEAMNRLAQIYQQNGAEDKRRFWLRKMIASHAAAGTGQTPRSLYLAAASSSVLANDEYLAFAQIAIAPPLAKAMKKKQAAMQRALQAYQQTNAYAVAEFSTQANFRMGEIYRDLGSALLRSPRPSNIDALALEQYELLLEEQAFPFEEKAIAIHAANAQRSWQGVYDPWVKNSFAVLAELLPARYAKTEVVLPYSQEIY